MFENLFGSVSRFIQQRLAPQQPAMTRQGQAKRDAFATKKGATPQKAWTPEGQAKLDANGQGKLVPPPFEKPMAYGKPAPRK